ncbi:hypothetical protein ACI7RC_14315 [Brevibacillus sp. B_LB10_24]|uniref:hypothetical protein n=1 Tax=Brevibacillus sp. B_LB10_24 TaxID=3380645 RepID=UPI0038B95E1E
MIHSSDQDFIHERCDRRMEPFYWILTFEAMSFVFLLGIALIGGPIYLVYLYQSWTYILLLLLLPGAWLVRFTIRYLRSAIRKNRLLNRYKLYEDRIEYRIYNHSENTVREDAIRFGQIDRVYVSKYISQYDYAYRKSKLREAQPVFRILPIIYIQYRDGMNKKRVLAVPFYENGETEIWLKELQNHGTPLWATNRLLSELPEEEQLGMLDEEVSSMPFPFDRYLQPKLDSILNEIERRERAKNPDEFHDAAQAQVDPRHSGTAGRNALQALMRLKPQRSTLIIFTLLFAFLFVSIKLADKGIISPDSTGICLAVLFVAAVVYQYLVKHLTFWVPLRFLFISFFGWALIGGFMLESSAGPAPGEEYYTSAMAAVILMAGAVWPLFGILYWLRRKRRDRRGV